MDYNQSNLYQQPAPPRKANGFAIASMVCGIVSLVCCCAGLGLPLGALALLFAILTRRKGQQMNPMAITGIVTGIIGLLTGLYFSLEVLVVYTDPEFQQEMYDSFEDIYGEEYADMFAEIYGWDLDELK